MISKSALQHDYKRKLEMSQDRSLIGEAVPWFLIFFFFWYLRFLFIYVTVLRYFVIITEQWTLCQKFPISNSKKKRNKTSSLITTSSLGGKLLGSMKVSLFPCCSSKLPKVLGSNLVMDANCLQYRIWGKKPTKY